MTALDDKFPALKSSLPRVPLADLPTPLRRARGLSQQLNIALTIKQDAHTSRLYGGNKVRKLEYLLGAARARNCDSVITFGAIGSNHALATAVHAHQLGLKCHAILTDQPASPYVDRTLRYHALLGTHLHVADGYQESLQIAQRITDNHSTGSDRIMQIPWGGSSWLGSIGFVNAGLELAQQIDEREQPTRLYVACGTMGTVAGLAFGLRLAKLETQIEAVRVVPEPVTSQRGLERLMSEINQELTRREPSIPVLSEPLKSVRLRHEFFGHGYAEATPESRAAVDIAAQDQLQLETTYTGKAMAALIADASAGLLQDQQILFWNTYSSAAYPPEIAAAPTSHFPAELARYLSS